MGQFKPNDCVNHLTLRERIYVRGRDSKGRASWKCDCVCGREVVRREDYLASGKSISCGCQNTGRMKPGKDCHLWKGVGELSGQFFGAIKGSAKKRGLEFAITIEYLWELFEKQEGECMLSGSPLVFYGFRERQRGLQQTASLDRKDQMQGYVEGNVQWVHKDVNMMKKEYPEARYIEVCKLVAAHAA